MASSTIRLWLIEDDALYSRAVGDLLAETEDISLERSFMAFEPALEVVGRDEPPDVCLTDIGLPGRSGTEGAREMKAAAPETQILMLTIHEDEDTIFDALCAGASGYLLKSATSERIIRAIREVHLGGVTFTPTVARKVLRLLKDTAAPSANYGLTDREREILQYLADGVTQKRIAEHLFVSPHTVDTHVRHIYAKLHVRSGIAAVSKAIREGLI